nr:immunoglobulin heavy chain junction region [Macaca mulatta]MOV41188.1 immunoglobulin heavy chain junction region [Macaca mulatta]MOV41711.1 immunoglobulin heavy chain junction region [Macaca mulatta]MOV43742.1 immunoglobulin heavy chain junction region [Macaca mulatta]MOV45080.1 immunoglobulin heavy chain junction region [Macaca mulatta]
CARGGGGCSGDVCLDDAFEFW